MLWADRVDLSKYIVAAGCFGGPIGKRSSNYKLKDSVLYMYFLSLLVCTKSIWDALHDLVLFGQFKHVKNTNGQVLLLVKLHAIMVPNRG